MAHDNTRTIGGVEINVSYMIIWAVLLGLTFIEVFIPEMAVGPNGPKPGGLLDDLFGRDMDFFGRNVAVALLVVLAIAKTYCVAWFYMHLVDERPLIVLIGCTPFIFSVFLTIGLFPW